MRYVNATLFTSKKQYPLDFMLKLDMTVEIRYNSSNKCGLC